MLLLLLGAALIPLTFMRYGVGELGWVVFAPLLLFAYAARGWRDHLALFVTLLMAFLVALLKISTSEVSWRPLPFAVPVSLAYFVAIVPAGLVHRRLGARWAAYTFASMAVVAGWVQYEFTPISGWGVLAHTQLENLPLMQLAALTGMGGITFLVALGSGLAAAAWIAGVRTVRFDIAALVALVVAALLYGDLRLGRSAPGATVRVGSVVSPVTHNEFHEALAGIDTLRRLDDELFARTERAADRGARVIVWNEMATLVTTGGENALASRGRALAKARGVMLVMAYGVVRSMSPFHDTNKYRVYLPDGTLADEYVKRIPVPGDPDDVGLAHARVVTFAGTKYVGAICYDYGFPEIARDNARDGGQIALVPASDWRGIDPEHGRMALMNAVAVGLPMVRPVRAATSIASDQFGRLVATMRSDAMSGGVMIADVPVERVPTVYARTGEIVPLLALAFCVLAAARARRTRAVPAVPAAALPL